MTDQEARPEITDDYEVGYAEGFHHGRSTPAPREITDEMVERAARAHHIFVWGDDLDPHFPMPRDEHLAMRAALEAALNPEGDA